MGNLYFAILTALRYTLQAFNNITIDKMHFRNKHDILIKIAFELTFMEIPTQAEWNKNKTKLIYSKRPLS